MSRDHGLATCAVKITIFRGGPPNLIFIGILLFLLLRNPCKNLKSYVMPLWGFSNGTKKLMRSSVILARSAVILTRSVVI